MSWQENKSRKLLGLQGSIYKYSVFWWSKQVTRSGQIRGEGKQIHLLAGSAGNPTGENKNATINFEPNLKQVLLNTGQDDGHWPGPYPGFPENGLG